MHTACVWSTNFPLTADSFSCVVGFQYESRSINPQEYKVDGVRTSYDKNRLMYPPPSTPEFG